MDSRSAAISPDSGQDPEPANRGVVDGPSFVINGRFLTQLATGVQRYATEVTAALDTILLSRRTRAVLVSPAPSREPTNYRAIDIELVGPAKGHVWEQTRLFSRGGGAVLNLCNTAPALGRRNIVCIHDANVFVAPESYSWSFRTFYKLLQPLIARRALAVVTVSKDAAAKIAAHLGVPAGRISVLPNGYEHALRWSPERSRYKGTKGRPYVLMIGSVAKHKNIARVMGLAERLDAFGLDIRIAGGSAAIFAQAAGKSAPNVQWLGRVSDDDLAFLLQNAMCLAFPSVAEGFGIPALEAMTWGCPVVASGTSSLPEVCGDAALFADPTDDAQWLDRIGSIARSRELRDTLRQKGLARARTFSWIDSAQGYYDLACAA